MATPGKVTAQDVPWAALCSSHSCLTSSFYKGIWYNCCPCQCIFLLLLVTREIASKVLRVFIQDLWMGFKAENLLLNIHALSHFENQLRRWLKYNFCEMGFLPLGQLLKKDFADWDVSQQSPSSCFSAYGFINLCLWHHNLLLWESYWYHKQRITTSKWEQTERRDWFREKQNIIREDK